MEEVLIFANPIAGRGRGRSIARRLDARLRAEGWSTRISFRPPAQLTREETSGPVRAAIVIGGDGTLRAVVERLVALRDEAPPILPVPLGTANLMVRHLGFALDDELLETRISDAIAGLHVRRLDAGRANGRLFLLMAGIGFDAHVVHELDRMRTGPINYLSYVLPAALALRDYRFPALRVIADDREIWSKEPAVAFVGNVKEYGTGFAVLPFARPDDGLLDVCVLPCGTLVDLARLLLLAAAGEHVQAEGAAYLTARRVRIESDAPVPVQVDGDAAGQTPVECDLLPVRLPFIVPA